jgi:hypothetical protein
MSKVICNAIGMHEECKNCGASKPHDDTSCEPCPLFDYALCKPIIVNIPIKCICYHCLNQPSCTYQGQHVKQCANFNKDRHE